MCKVAFLMGLYLFLHEEGVRFPENYVSIWSLFSEVCKTSQKRKYLHDKDPHIKSYLGKKNFE